MISEYTEATKEEICKVAEEFISRGHSLDALAGELGIVRKTVYNWKDAHPEFAIAVDRGFAKRQAHIEKLLMSSAANNTGNASTLIFLGKNWAGLRDKMEQEVSGSGGGPLLITWANEIPHATDSDSVQSSTVGTPESTHESPSSSV